MPNYLTTQIPLVRVITPFAIYYKPAPTGYASWLTKTISQPYFTPYDVNSLVWNPNAGDLRTLPVAPTHFSIFGDEPFVR